MQFVGADRVIILHAGETGNAEEVAYEIQSKLKVNSTVVPIDQYDIMNLPDEKCIVFAVSTTGEGDIPDIMKKFWNFLLRKSLTNDALSGLNYSVFGLGDSSYDKFNAVARKLDKRLQMLGAISINPLGLGDDQAPYGYLSALNNWVISLALHVRTHSLGSNSISKLDDELTSYHITLSNPSFSQTSSELRGVNGREIFSTTVAANERLTAKVWGQDVRHVRFQFDSSVDSSALYEVGDVAMVYYSNPPELVSKALAVVAQCLERHGGGYTATSTVDIEFSGTARSSRLGSLKACSLHSLLERHLDIGAVPKRSYFLALAPYATNPEEASKLLELASDAGTDLYFDYCTKERKSYVEVLEEFRSCRPSVAVLLGAVQLIPPRQYSIASSPALCPRHIELCVAVSQRTTPYGRKRTGLCSGFIARLTAGDVVRVSIKPGSLRGTPLSTSVPALVSDNVDSSTHAHLAAVPKLAPNILVGPGTGVAPMRGLIQHEIARQMFNRSITTDHNPSTLTDTPNTVLFFGCRKSERDNLYAADWAQVNAHRNPFSVEAGYAQQGSTYCAEMQPSSVVVNTAFSQDQLVKVYVTHKIKAQGELVCRLLQQGANVFVVGSSKRMPKDVRSALCAVLEEHASLSPAESDTFLTNLVRRKKYIVETW